MLNKVITSQPLLYLGLYYYSYSFLYECPFGKQIFKQSIYPFHMIWNNVICDN